MATNPSTASVSAPRLRRTLTLWDLILYGVIVIQPVAPMSSFGALSNRGQGHVVTAILIAMVAMLFTGISYGRMARVYPSAGSAFTYVAQEIHPGLGYVTGWSMVMDYMLICDLHRLVRAGRARLRARSPSMGMSSYSQRSSHGSIYGA